MGRYFRMIMLIILSLNIRNICVGFVGLIIFCYFYDLSKRSKFEFFYKVIIKKLLVNKVKYGGIFIW